MAPAAAAPAAKNWIRCKGNAWLHRFSYYIYPVPVYAPARLHFSLKQQQMSPFSQAYTLLCLATTRAGSDSIYRLQTLLTTIAVGITVCLVIWQTISEHLNRRRKRSEERQKALDEAEQIVADARLRAEEIREHAKQDVVVTLKQARLQAQEAVVTAKEKFEQGQENRRREFDRIGTRLAQREDSLDQRESQLQARMGELAERESELAVRQAALESHRQELESAQLRQQEALQAIAGMTAEEARQTLLSRLEKTLLQERSRLIRRYQEESRQMLTAEAQKIMIDAMQRYAGDCTYERTTSTIPLPNEEMKGRIIGRDGRNIRTIEAATGVSILIDDTPQAVVISCFDPIRREIARQAMELLVSDGRIHPAHIEEVVGKVRKEIEVQIDQAGQQAAESLGIMTLRPNMLRMLGRLKYRYSFSQNALAHSMEVAAMMGAIAAEVGLDAELARRSGLLHDIGKAIDHEAEGSHALIGADLLRRAGEPAEVVNAVASHHGEVPQTSLLAVLVQICDTLSAGRPGARSQTTEFYLKRLEDLERIGNSFDGVEKCYAIQAGRELRVVVRPDAVSEDQAAVLAHEIAGRIEREMRYPGQIRVTIIRETRSIEYAK